MHLSYLPHEDCRATTSFQSALPSVLKSIFASLQLPTPSPRNPNPSLSFKSRPTIPRSTVSRQRPSPKRNLTTR